MKVEKYNLREPINACKIPENIFSSGFLEGWQSRLLPPPFKGRIGKSGSGGVFIQVADTFYYPDIGGWVVEVLDGGLVCVTDEAFHATYEAV